MATVITSECINCAACEPECPNMAIYQGGVQWERGGQLHPPLADDLFYIVPEKCTECVGFYDYEACAAVCPVDCCVPNPDVPETEAVLIARSKQLHPDLEFPAEFASRFKPPAAAGNRPAPKAAPAPASPAAKPVVAIPPTTPPAAPAVESAASPTPAAAVTPEAEAVVKPAAEPAMAEQPVPTPKAAAGKQPARRTERAFPGELSIPFQDAIALLQRRDEHARQRPRWLLALLARLRRPAGPRGGVGFDGFADARFEDKLERERRYGEVYRLREYPNGFLLEMEFPRRIPRSAIKEELGVPDEMPDYACRLALRNGFLTVTGNVVDPIVRKIAAVSPAFPPDFETHIELPSPVKGFRHRFRGKDLEVALIKHV